MFINWHPDLWCLQSIYYILSLITAIFTATPNNQKKKEDKRQSDTYYVQSMKAKTMIKIIQCNTYILEPKIYVVNLIVCYHISHNSQPNPIMLVLKRIVTSRRL